MTNPFQTQTILERHLKIGEALTTQQMSEMSKESPITMLRGAPGFKFVEKIDEVDGSTYTVIEWEDLQVMFGSRIYSFLPIKRVCLLSK